MIRRPEDLRRGAEVWMWFRGRWARGRVESVHVLEQEPRIGRRRGDYAKISFETIVCHGGSSKGSPNRIESGRPRVTKRWLNELIPVEGHPEQPSTPVDSRGQAEDYAGLCWDALDRLGTCRGTA